MYNNSKKETYSLYDCVNGYYLLVNVSQHSLVKYLVNKIDGTPWWSRPDRPTDTLLEWLDKSINMNGNDTFPSVNFAREDIQVLRPYMVLDSNDKIIDIRTWNLEKLYVEAFNKKRKRVRRSNTNPKRCYGHCRSPHIYQTLRAISDPETGPYIRKKIKNTIGDWYFEPYAQGSKSWKDQSKKRKQWE